MKRLFYLLFAGFCVLSCTSSQKITHLPIADYQYQSAHVLVDVRTAQEFSQGHLPEAVNMDVNDKNFEQKMAQFDKNQPIYLYCRSGKRSLQAARKLEKLGFKRIYNLEGGFLRWEDKLLDENSK